MKNLRTLLAAWLCLGLGACADRTEAPGSFSVTFRFAGTPPDPASESWWVVARVEVWPGGDTRKRSQLAETQPVAYARSVDLALPNIPYGRDRVVLIELRDSAEQGARVGWFGASALFETLPGEHVNVQVPLQPRPVPGADERGAAAGGLMRVESEDAAGTEVSVVQRPNVRLSFRPRFADSVEVANRREDFAVCAAAREAGELSTEGCIELEVESLGAAGAGGFRAWPEIWSLQDGDGDGVRTIYARFRNDVGYASELLSAQVTLDTRPPGLLQESSVSPEVASDGAQLVIVLYPDEPLAEPPTLTAVPTLDFGRPRLQGAGWVFSRSVDETVESGAYSLTARLVDLAGWVTSDAVPGSGEIQIDRSPPALSELAIARDRVSRVEGHDRLSLQFEAERGATVAAFVVGRAMQCEVSETRWSCHYDVRGDEAPAGGEAVRSLSVEARDAGGNVARRQAGVVFDFEPPSLLEGEGVFPRDVVRAADARIDLRFSEALAQLPALTVHGNRGAEGRFCAIAAEAMTTPLLAMRCGCELTLPGGSYELRATLVDLAGNQDEASLRGEAIVAGDFRVDDQAPAVLASEVRPPLVRARQSVAITFRVDEAPAVMPIVSVGAERLDAAACVPDEDSGAHDYLCHYEVAAVPVDGPRDVSVTLRDAAGNGTTAPLGSFVIDATPPTLLFSSVVPELANADDDIEVRFGFSEPIDPSSLTLDAAPLDLGEAVEADGQRYAFVLPRSRAADDGAHTVRVDARDLAGNPLIASEAPHAPGPQPVGVAALDRTPPSSTSGATIQGCPAPLGGSVTFGIWIQDSLLPEITLGGFPMTVEATGGAYRVSREITADMPEGTLEIRALARDAAGNELDLEVGTCRVDLTPPALVENSATVALTPPPGALLREVSKVTEGTRVRLTFLMTEALDASSDLRVRDRSQQLTLRSCAATGALVVCDEVVSGLPPGASGRYSLHLEPETAVVDEAGNRSTSPQRLTRQPGQSVLVELDATAPDSPPTEALGQIVYRRAPWGRDTDPTPHFALDIAADAFDAGDTVFVFDRPDPAQALLLDRVTIEGGVAPSITLPQRDLERVYLLVNDEAGNASGARAALVREVVWTAGGADSPLNPSPHLFEGTPRWSTLRLRGHVAPTAPITDRATLAAVDGEAWTVSSAPVWRHPISEDGWPATSFQSGFATDTVRGRHVLYGADTAARVVWEYDGLRWTAVPAPGAPDATAAQLSFDAATAQTLLITPDQAQTWMWDGSRWRAGGDRPALFGASGGRLAYDEHRGRTVLYGAFDESGAPGTFEWVDEAWVQVGGGLGSAPEREDFALAFDRDTAGVLLFGGRAAGGTVQRDTWLWDGVRWAQVSTDAPDARYGHAMTISSFGVATLFGGTDSSDTQQGDLWEWRSDHWETVYTPTVSRTRMDPPYQAFAKMTRGLDHRLLWIGVPVRSGSPLPGANLMAWTGARWLKQRRLTSEPSCIVNCQAMARVPDDDRLVVVGGGGNAGWTFMSLGSSGLSAGNANQVTWQDAVSGLVVVPGLERPLAFGFATGFDMRAWSVAPGVGGAQALSSQQGLPQHIRGRSCVVYDGSRGVSLLIGGKYQLSKFSDETWRFDADSGTFSELPVDASFRTGRHWAACGYDPEREEVVLFGGYARGTRHVGSTPLFDTWTLDDAGWRQRHGAPPRIIRPAITYDARRRALILLGQNESTSAFETYEWTGGWQQLSAVGATPSAHRAGSLVAYDERREQVVSLRDDELRLMEMRTWQRSAALARFDLAPSAIDPEDVLDWGLSAIAGGDAADDEPGVRLISWLASAGYWVQLANSDASGADLAPLSTRRNNSALPLRRFLLPDGSFHMGVTTLGTQGRAATHVSVDHLQLELHALIPEEAP